MEHETNPQKNNITKWNMKQINRKITLLNGT